MLVAHCCWVGAPDFLSPSPSPSIFISPWDSEPSWVCGSWRCTAGSLARPCVLPSSLPRGSLVVEDTPSTPLVAAPRSRSDAALGWTCNSDREGMWLGDSLGPGDGETAWERRLAPRGVVGRALGCRRISCSKSVSARARHSSMIGPAFSTSCGAKVLGSVRLLFLCRVLVMCSKNLPLARDHAVLASTGSSQVSMHG
jgi:hypothetical protein